MTHGLMRLPLGLPLAGPTLPWIGHRLKWPSLVGRPDRQTELFAGLVRLLDQLFLGAVSGSVTSTTPALRLRWTLPVSHQVRLACQVKPASCKTVKMV